MEQENLNDFMFQKYMKYKNKYATTKKAAVTPVTTGPKASPVPPKLQSTTTQKKDTFDSVVTDFIDTHFVKDNMIQIELKAFKTKGEANASHKFNAKVFITTVYFQNG